jgi:hypothetical protein
VQFPEESSVTVVPVTVQIDSVEDVKVIGSLEETVAVNVGLAPYIWAPGFAKVMV